MLTTAHYEVPGTLQVISALGPVFALAAAVIAALIAYGTLQQRRAADAKSEWWRRTQWALEQLLSGDPQRANVGTSMLNVLVASDLATEEELDLLRSAWDDVLGPVVDDVTADADVVLDEGSDDGDGDGATD